MGWIAVAAPYIASGVGALSGYLSSRKAGKRSEEEQVALGGAQQAAGGLARTGTNLLGATQGPRDYWSTLLRGDRGAMQQATAAPRAAITDVYRGAERGLDRSGIRGAQRDVALGDLIRERASKIAGLTTGVQGEAAQNLFQFGQLGAPLLGQAGSIWAGLLGQGAANRMYADEEKAKAGRASGQYLFDLASGISNAYGGRNKTPGVNSNWAVP
jgi:hypothetical protein